MTKQKTILIIEDEVLIGRAYKTGLEKEGFEVTLIENGEDALKELVRCSYDLVLLDIILPGLNGFDLLEKRKREGICKDANILVLSNLGQDSDIERAKRLGVQGYLVKADHSMGEVISKVKQFT